MKKSMRVMLILMLVLAVNLVLYHVIKSYLSDKEINEKNKPVTVSSMSVMDEEWQSSISNVADLVAFAGVNITTEVPGKIQEVFVSSGQQVKKGDKILQLHAEPDIAALKSLQAAAHLAKSTYERDKEQYAINVVSKETLDGDLYTMQMQQALAEQQQAIVDLKTIRAPFAGKIGIFYPTIGQFLNPGDYIASIQAVDPIYAYFKTSERHVTDLQVGQAIKVTTDVFPGEEFSGKITALDALVDDDSHTITIETVIENPQKKLLPGMYAVVEAEIGKPKKLLTIPQSAVSYNPYGNLVYVILQDKDKQGEKNADKETHKKTKLRVKQRFVTLGETRDDQVAVISGLQAGELIVTSGQLKLKNNDFVIINNETSSENNAKLKVDKHT